jgi:hypothetical protein
MVAPAVSRIEIELANGEVVSAQSRPAPEALATEVRTFLIRAAFEKPYGPGHPPLIRAYTFVAADGRILERLNSRSDLT